MATWDQLQGAFGSLSDTLSFRFDPGFPPDLSSRWLGVLGIVARIGHRTDAWNAAPGESADFDPVIAALDNASRGIASAGTSDARLAALDVAEAALQSLDALLG
ncbi:hypothetical protein [Sphingomonas sp. KR3-1]|uniref:hypothetical protein n=1 Tax=Sphingomonas sp. KR3-1 TaxID=3156611 RepID=UPI0032B618E0